MNLTRSIPLVLVTAAFLTTAAIAQAPFRDKHRGDRDGRHGWTQKPLTDEQYEELAAFLKKNDPARLEKLEELKENRPEMYEKVAARGYWGMKRMEKLKENDPEAYKKKMEYFKLEGEVRTLARTYRESKDDSEKAKIKKDLTPKLNRLFDLRQEDRRQEIKHLQEKVAELEKSIVERKKNKTKIVEDHREKILGEDEDLEW